MNREITDKEMLDFLDQLTGGYTGKVILRMSSMGRGMRLHETSMSEATESNVRDAIKKVMREGFA